MDLFIVPAHQHVFRPSNCSVQAGRWQGPWATAKALEQACQAHAGVLEDAQLHIKVLDEPGGGVPQFYPGRCALQGCSVGVHAWLDSRTWSVLTNALVHTSSLRWLLSRALAHLFPRYLDLYDDGPCRLILLIPLVLGLNEVGSGLSC